MALSVDNLVHLGVPVAQALEFVKQEATIFTVVTTSNPTLAAGVGSGSSYCIVQVTANGANAITLRTAAQMLADIPGAQSGFNYMLRIFNSGNGTATLTAPDGNTTISGVATIPSGTSREYNVSFTSATQMTITNTGSTVGLDVTTVGVAQIYPLNYRTIAPNGNVYVYGQAQIAVAQYDAITIDSSGNINSLMAANVKAGQQIGTAQVAIPASSFGWVCISGNGLLINVKASTQVSVPVIPGTVTGQLDTTAGVAAGITSILGVQILTTAGLTATAIGASLTSPVLKL